LKVAIQADNENFEKLNIFFKLIRVIKLRIVFRYILQYLLWAKCALCRNATSF